MEHFSVNSVISLSNVLFFMVVQVFFFWYIASRLIDQVVLSKAAVIMLLREKMRNEKLNDTVQSLDALMVTARRKCEADAKRKEETRSQQNYDLMVAWTGPAIAIVTILLVSCLVYNHRKQLPFTTAHKVGMAMVVCAYITEVLFFLLVVSNYVMVSDTDIVRDVLGLKATNDQRH